MGHQCYIPLPPQQAPPALANLQNTSLRALKSLIGLASYDYNSQDPDAFSLIYALDNPIPGGYFVVFSHRFATHWNFPLAIPDHHLILKCSQARPAYLRPLLQNLQDVADETAVIGFTFKRRPGPVLLLTSTAAYRQWASNKLPF